jgi:hypothetical protein
MYECGACSEWYWLGGDRSSWRNLVQCHLFPHISNLGWPGTDTRNFCSDISANEPWREIYKFMRLCWIAKLSRKTSLLVLAFRYTLVWEAVLWVQNDCWHTPVTNRRLDCRPGDNFLFRHLFLASVYSLSCFLLPVSSDFAKARSEKDVLTVVPVLFLLVWDTDICQLVHWSGHRAKHSSVWPVRIRWNTSCLLKDWVCSEFIWHSPPTS